VKVEGESVLVYVLKGDYVLLFTCLQTGHRKCSRFCDTKVNVGDHVGIRKPVCIDEARIKGTI
jgi:hypothetical protein